jgi:hypothetical protein
MFDEVVEVRERLASLVDQLDPDAVSGSAARELWAVLDASERLCAAGKTLLASRIAATHRPQTAGAKTAAEEMARKAGITSGAAKDAVDTSKRLPEQPDVESALRRGVLSAAQAALVSAAAAANPAAEARLVELAPRVSMPELREECSRVKAAADPDPDATNRRLHAGRRLRRWIDGEGFWTLLAKGTPQAGAAFCAVLDAVSDQVFQAARRAGRTEPVEAYAFDALMALADRTANHSATDCSGTAGAENGQIPASATAGPGGGSQPDRTTGGFGAGQGPAGPGADDDAGLGHGEREPALIVPGGNSSESVIASGAVLSARWVPEMPRRWNPRYRALLRVDVTALHRGRVQGEELCEIAGVGPVPVSVAEGLLGRSVLHLVITRGTDVVNVTHLGRGPTAAQKVALAWQTPTCTVEGCSRTRTENDHRQPWAETRHTRLDQMDPLCPFHHDLKTRYGWALAPGSGKRPMVPPDDARHPRHRTDSGSGARPPPPDRVDAASALAATSGPSPSEATPPRGRTRPAQPSLLDPPGDPHKGA